MTRLIRLLGALFSMSLRRQLAFRTDLFFELVLTVVGLSASLAALGVIYTRTDALGGWHPGEAIVVLGTFQILSGMRATFIEPNLRWFGDQIKNGRFDAVLLQPAPSILLASLGTYVPIALSEVAFGGGLVVLGARPAMTTVTVLAWLALVAAAIAITWAGRLLLASLAFWAPDLSLDVVFDAVWQFGRYPTTIYRRPLRLILGYVLPVTFVATVPADVLVRGGRLTAVPVALAVAVTACLLAIVLWRIGLRRYTSATS